MLQRTINFIKNYWRLLALGALFGLIALFFLSNTPHLKSTLPALGASGVDLNSDLTFTFDRGVKPEDFEIRSKPDESFTFTQPSKNVLVLSHAKSFYQATLYTVDVYYRSQKITTLSFTTQQSESNPRDLQALQDAVEHDYPLAGKLPLTTNSYQVVYTAPLTLQVELYDAGLDQNRIRAAVNTWIKSQGVDPSTHTLVFKLPSHPAPTTQK